MKQINYSNLFIGFALAFMLSNTVIMYITFFGAYFNNYKILVTVNELGEAKLEMGILIVFLFIVSIGVYEIFKMIEKKILEENR